MALISNKHKIILFRFPKTGSTTVKFHLQPYCDIHAIPHNYNSAITSKNPLYSHITPAKTLKIFKMNKKLNLTYKFKDYFKFCFVRNPWERVFSLYKMIKPNDDFTNFVNNLERMANNANKPWVKYGAYDLKRYISDSKGNILVDHVFKLEDIDTEFVDKMSQFGIIIDKIAHKKHRTQKYDYRGYYNNYTKNKVKKLYKYEIKTFNYTF